MRRWGSHMMLQYWLKMSQQRAELSGERSHFNLKSAMLWPEQGLTSWIWLRSSKKEPFVCCDQHSLSSSDPTAMVPVPKLLKTTLKPPNIWNFEGPLISKPCWQSHLQASFLRHMHISWSSLRLSIIQTDEELLNMWRASIKVKIFPVWRKKKKKKKRSEHSLTYTKSLAAN